MNRQIFLLILLFFILESDAQNYCLDSGWFLSKLEYNGVEQTFEYDQIYNDIPSITIQELDVLLISSIKDLTFCMYV